MRPFTFYHCIILLLRSAALPCEFQFIYLYKGMGLLSTCFFETIGPAAKCYPISTKRCKTNDKNFIIVKGANFLHFYYNF